MNDMAKRKRRTRGPQTLATQAQYLLNQRRVKLWIPFLEARIAESGLEPFCQVLPALPIDQLPALYQGAAAVFHPAPAAPWGGALRRALACGRPVVAVESPLADALIGSAGYAVPAEETRRLGAALITVIVEEDVAAKLGDLGRDRAAAWQEGDFSAALGEVYRRVLGR